MIDLKPACEAMTRVLAGITDDQLTNATPCPELTVGDLVDHVDLVVRGSTALARRDAAGSAATASGPDAVHLEPGWRELVADRVRAMGVAWDDPAAWEGRDHRSGPDLSNETWAKIALDELVVHGWDLARATGQPFALPEPTLRACLDHVADFIPNAPVPGLWGPPVEVPDDAPLLDRIVAVNGRMP